MASKIINLLRYDREMMISPNMGIGAKLSLIIRKYITIGLNKRNIRYLGNNFYYDGRFSSVPLQMYPREIAFLDKNINLIETKTVLDIGANIGQFAFSLKSFFPNAAIFCFEPNQEIFPLLKKNMSYFDKVELFNYGIGRNGQRSFYYSPSSSGLGSFFQENVHQFGKKRDLKEIIVNVIELNQEKLEEFKIPSHFDLIKIDVEGAEIEVLKSLKGTGCNYLFLEVSVNRKGKTEIIEIIKLIEKTFENKITLIASKRLSNDAPSMDCIFRMDTEKLR